MLVTGAAGFVGSNLARRFAAEGDRVIALDRVSPDAAVTEYLVDVLERISFVQADVCDETWHRTLPVQAFDTVIHAAAITNTREGEEVSRARAAVAVNILGSVNVVSWAIEARPRRFLHLSSGATYGRIVSGPDNLDEDRPAQPDTVYALTKYAAERIVLRLAKQTALPLVALRLPSQYGPMERDTSDRTRLSSIQSWCSAAAQGAEVVVNRSELPRDYTYVYDVADAVYRLSVTPDLRYDLYNIGTGIASSPDQIVAAIRETVPDVRVRYVTNDAIDESDRKPVSIARLRSDTGWQPQYTLSSGIAVYIDWLRRVPAAAVPRHA
ncbi:MAG TPA: NAD(P)-dependent oxidoreductase [Polyangiaceae bacterium]|nr:NAD(P)-dependent oxidoreductase [Polyangiaceae bacterium]